MVVGGGSRQGGGYVCEMTIGSLYLVILFLGIQAFCLSVLCITGNPIKLISLFKDTLYDINNTIMDDIEIIMKLLVKYKPDIKFEFTTENPEDSEFIMLIRFEDEFGSKELYVKRSDNWVIVKNKINLLISRSSGICEICDNEMGIKENKIMTCNNCCNDYCFNCYIGIYKTKNGKSICPFCRDGGAWDEDEHPLIVYLTSDYMEKCKTRDEDYDYDEWKRETNIQELIKRFLKENS